MSWQQRCGNVPAVHRSINVWTTDDDGSGSDDLHQRSSIANKQYSHDIVTLFYCGKKIGDNSHCVDALKENFIRL